MKDGSALPLRFSLPGEAARRCPQVEGAAAAHWALVSQYVALETVNKHGVEVKCAQLQRQAVERPLPELQLMLEEYIRHGELSFESEKKDGTLHDGDPTTR